ncbi:MAG: DUF11 domain-containing protein, partial [Actinomycetia bacterium]|nr:DUF11 domain-containing protein [Actinomycetes bacterium]
QQTLTVQVTAASGEVIDATAEIFDQLSAAKPARASSVAAVRSARPLTLSISASPDPVRPGEEVVYALTVTNASGVAQTGLVLDATTPTDMTVSSGDLTDGGVCPGSSCSPGEVAQWSLGTLADGASRTVALSAHLDSISPLPDGTILSLAATVSDGGSVAAAATRNVVADSTPDLALGLSSGSEPVEPGGLVTYELVYAHRGSTAALDALLRMPVPVGTTFVSASGGGALVGNTVEWSLGAFAVQAAGQQTLTVQVTAASGEVIDATAEIFDQLSAAKPARASSVAAVRSARPLT